MAIKVIIMDVDGTLTNQQKEITPKTKQALIKAQQQGTLLVLASGRPTSGLIKFAKELRMDEHHGLLVSYNGSKVLDVETMEVLFNETMSIMQEQAVLQHMKKFDVIVMIDKDDYMYVENVYDCTIHDKEKAVNIIEYEARGGNYKLCEVDDLASFVHYPLNKILTAGDSTYMQQHYQEMMAPFKGMLNCMFTSSFYFEFTAKGIDKAKALDTVLSSLGYKREEMIAFGDGQNDISMLQYAGIGVAMENAVSQLKAVADEISESNENDGIASALYRHMPEIFG